MMATSDTKWYHDLVAWMRKHGGEIHSSLDLDLGGDKSNKSRGIRASSNIPSGALLIRLPAKLALDGSHLPQTFDLQTGSSPTEKKESRSASPWLRCLASLLIESTNTADEVTKTNKSDVDFGPYLASLPASYDTLIDEDSWPTDDVNILLSGTSLATQIQEERKHDMLKQRYNASVRPFLNHLGLFFSEDDEIYENKQFNDFIRACACVSTRGFHLQDEGNTSAHPYSGPFLLPYIDMLNHCPAQKCTTLQRDSNSGSFLMIAERDIAAGEEIFHSYGSDLTSAQLLQTFGFVERGAAKRAAENHWTQPFDITPATISAKSILNAAQSIIDSSFPKDLIDAMEEQGIPDDTWELPSETRHILSHGLLSDDVLISPNKPLSDELVTLCCLPFLPSEVYSEWAEEPCVWGIDILEDYFLGKLALRALMKAVIEKMKGYTAISMSACGLKTDGKQRNVGGANKSDEQDTNSLSLVIGANGEVVIDEDRRKRAIYGLTIRLEEKHCLFLLKKEIVNLSQSLDDDEGFGDDEEGDGDGTNDGNDQIGERSNGSGDIHNGDSSKKRKLSL